MTTAFLVFLLCGCSKSGESEKQTADKASQADTQSPGKSSPGKGSAGKKPKATSSTHAVLPAFMKITDTAAAKLGTLPDGVGLAVGTQAPDLAGTDAAGQRVQLGKLVEDQRVLLVFYRGGWCPYCNTQIRSLSQAAVKFEALGIKPVLISVDKPSEASKTNAKYDIPFPVLSDPSLVWHKAFGVLNVIPAAKADELKKYGIDLEASSGQKHLTVAVPSVFLLEKGGRISFAHAERDYKVRPLTESLLKALAKLPAGS